MEQVILGGKVIAFAGTVGSDLIFTAVRTTSIGVINGIEFICSSDKNGVESIKFELEALDLNNKVGVIDKFTQELIKTNLLESIKMALIGVENILFKMSKEITEINTKIKEHSEKWFNGWRSFDCNININTIKSHNKILDMRLDLLLKLMQVNRN